MSLRVQAEADLSFTIEDPQGGFGWPCVLTSPDGVQFPLTALTQDIAAIIDPDTGVGVKGRETTASFRKTSLPPGVEAVQSENEVPWVVTFEDIEGASYDFKIKETNRDSTMGVLVCFLEPYTV